MVVAVRKPRETLTNDAKPSLRLEAISKPRETRAKQHAKPSSGIASSLY